MVGIHRLCDGHEPGAIRAEGEEMNVLALRRNHRELLARRRVPDLDRPPGVDEGQPRAVAGEGYTYILLIEESPLERPPRRRCDVHLKREGFHGFPFVPGLQ